MKQKLKRLLSSFSIYSEMPLKIWHNGTILDLKKSPELGNFCVG